jgi:SAM-dependent methyltransferase
MTRVNVPAPLAAVRAIHGQAVFSRRVRILAERIAPLLPGGQRVLDVGCGDGSIASALRTLRPDLTLQGYDVLVRPEALIPVAPFDGKRLPVPDDAADAVLLLDVLHHAEDAVALLRECGRAAPVVLVKDHFAESAFDRQILRFMDWVGNAPHGVRLPYHYFSTVSWSSAVSAAGLHETERGGVPGLYPFPFSLLFGGRLHFVARLQPSR